MLSALWPAALRSIGLRHLRLRYLSLILLLNLSLLASPGFSPAAMAQATPVLSINAGGGAAGSFAADQFVQGGSTDTQAGTIDTSGVTNPAPQAVYQSERYGNSTYTLPGLTPGGSYTVRLHFAETFYGPGMPGGGGTGTRQFNVLVNGAQVLTNFDIFAAAGGANTAIVKSYSATANASGNITVAFTQGAADNAKVSGIEVFAAAPTPPTALAATAGNASVALSWSAPGGAVTGYNIYRSTTSGTGYTRVNTGAVTAASYTDTGVTNGTTYYYVVTALDSTGESAYSNQAGAAPLSQPAAAVLSINSGGGAVGSFSADTGFQGGYVGTYTAAVDTSAANAAPQAVYQSERFGTSTYALTGLTPNASYTLRLHFCENYWTGAGHRLFDVTVNGQVALPGFDVFAAAGAANKAVVRDVPAAADGTGAITVHFQATASSPDQNAKVSGLQVLPAAVSPPSAPSLSGSAGGQTASLTWTAPAGTVTGYGLYRSGDGGTTYAAIGGALPSGTTAYTDAGLSGGKNYLYYVVAVNGGGTSPRSNTLSLTTAAVPVLTSIVVSPATASLTPNGSQQFTATAKDQSGVALSPQPSLTWSLDSGGVGTISGTGLYTAGAAAGSATVRATSGTVSGTASVTVMGPPAAPTNLAATGGDSKVTLTWTAPAGTVTSYNVKRSPTSGGPYTAVSTPGAVTTPSYTDSSAFNGTTYYYVASAVGTAGEGASSSQASATPMASSASSPPTNLIARASSSQVGLAWTASSGATSYNLYRRTVSGGEAITSLQTGLVGTSTLDAAVAGGQTYFYQVTAVGNGESGRSNEASTGLATGPNSVSGTPVFLSDLLLPGTVQIGWAAPLNLQSPTYTWSRFTDATRAVSAAGGPTTALMAGDAFPFVPGTTYPYGVSALGSISIPSPTNGSPLVVPNIGVDLGGITVTPTQPVATDNQTADSRQDARNTPVVNLNHKFAATIYRGGLYTGFVNPSTPDSSRVGRSFAKFLLSPLPAGQGLWANVGNLYLYYTQSFDANAISIQADPVPSTWSGATLVWDGAPPLALISGAEQPAVPGANNSWMRWHKYGDILGGMQASPLLSYGLISTNEASDGWAYFAKKEFAPTLAPCLLYGAGGYAVSAPATNTYLNPAGGPVGTISGNAVSWTNANGMVTLSRVAPIGGLTLTLTVSDPSVAKLENTGNTTTSSAIYVTIPAGQFSGSFVVVPVYYPPAPTPPATLQGGSKAFSISVSGGVANTSQAYSVTWQ